MVSPLTLPWLRRQRWLAPLVLACVWLAVLAPTVSRWQQAHSGVPVWELVCRSVSGHQGVQWMRVQAPEQAGPGIALVADHDDCPQCALQHHGWAPPPVLAAVLPTLVMARAWPMLFWQAPRPLFAWLAPWSTGPPALV